MTRLHQPRGAGLNSTSSFIPPAPGAQTVRRNLFCARASRRPVRSDSTTSSAATTVIENPLDAVDDTSSTPLSTSSSTSSEILVRNASGDYAVAIPSASMLMDESHAEAVGEQQGDDFEDDDHLLELLRTRTRQSNEQELLDAVRLSLKRKVDALVEDDWMFQGGK